MSITEIAIKRPSLIIVVFTVLMLGGLFCYKQLNYELMPDFSVPTLVVSTQYPGASSTDVEQTVTKKIEDVLAGLNGVKNIKSTSSEGVSMIVVEFKVGSNMDIMQQDAQRKINNILSTLPDNVKNPSILKITPSDAPIMQLSAVSNLLEADFYDLMNDIVLPQFQQVEGVGEITMTGGRQREIQVNIDKDKLNHYGLSILQVTKAIGNANADFPTGKVKTRDESVTVRLAGKFSSVDQIKDLIVATPNGGSPIRVGDIADIADVVKDQSAINRYNGKDGIGLSVKKQNDANAVEISKQIQDRIAKLETQYKDKGLKIVVADDSSVFTLDAADAVTHDLMIAVILVAAVMLLFLHSLRDSLIVLIAIPASLVSTFIAMYLLGYSLNLMTLLAMSLVIGILVDDSIVVLENIHRHLHMGKNKMQAAIDGRSEIGFSAVAITLVDVVVFAPIAMINSVIGDILRQYSITIVISTLMSLVVCFTLTPWLASRFGRVTHLSWSNWFQRPLIIFERGIDKLTNWYTNQLKWTLKHKLITSLAVIGAFVLMGVIMGMGILGQEFVAQGDRGKVMFKVEYDKSTSLQENNLRTRALEEYLKKQSIVKTIYTSVGSQSGDGFVGIGGASTEYKSEINVQLVDAKQRNISSGDFMIKMRDELMKQFPGLKINSQVVGIASSEEPIMIVISGDDQQKIIEAGNQLKRLIEKLPGSNDVTMTVEDGNPEVSIKLDREKMAQLGLDIATVGGTLQNAYTGNTDAKYRVGKSEYDINVRLDAFDRKSAEDVANITFVNTKGEQIKLAQFAAVTNTTGPSVLERKDRRGSVTIKSNVLGISSGVLSQKITEELKNHPLPSGVEWKWTGDVERQADAFGALGLALLAGFILIYLIMVALYDDFVYPLTVIFGAIPVAIIGAMIALNLAMSSMSIFTMLGIIMLMGLVTKNGILIVDFANQKKAEGFGTYDALIEAGKARLRPILMTTIAMVIGMLPIALAKGAGAEWKNGLAIVMMGGLLSSLMMTVFVVPMLYYMVDRVKEKLGKKKVANVAYEQAVETITV